MDKEYVPLEDVLDIEVTDFEGEPTTVWNLLFQLTDDDNGKLIERLEDEMY